MVMRSTLSFFAALCFAAALATSLLTTGCAVHARVYDGYYGDYHRWDDHEVVFYNRWEHDTHRAHVDFGQRSDADKKAYWTWRHSQH
jgi:hypothetical protein